ncbi:ATP-binding protein [Streptomyces sp. NPDC001658]
MSVGELSVLAWQLADALQDALLIADYRRTRLRVGHRPALRPSGGQEVQREPTRDRARPFTLLTLPGDDRASAGIARHHVRDTARAWELPPRTTDDLETITGELVGNAVEHSGSPTVTVSCALSAHAVVISVTDAGTGPCKPVAGAVPPRPEQERGRGLLITAALADRWGTQQEDCGLTVWAEVSLDPNEAPEHGDGDVVHVDQ